MKSSLVFLIVCAGLAGTAAAKTESKIENAKASAQHIEDALDMYFIDCHEFPPSLEWILKAPETCKFWGPDPYLEKIPTDPWGREWHYSRTDPHNFVLKSLGADGKEGGSGANADIVIKGEAPKLH
jgi:general secretion pathway protein G